MATKVTGRIRAAGEISAAQIAAAKITDGPFLGAEAPRVVGPQGEMFLSVEAAHNGLLVRRTRLADTASGNIQEFAVFTDAEVFGQWMAEHFRVHIKARGVPAVQPTPSPEPRKRKR